MSNSYKVLPPVYDRWQQGYGRDFSSLIFPKLLATIRFHKIPTSTMLDVACGTGTLALMMAKRGWEVWGIDASAGMIAEAEKKLRSGKSPVHFLHRDMREFNLDVQVVLATSFFDSLNHLLVKQDLLKAFRRVHAHLLPGGFFIFDVNNERCYKTLWKQTDTIKHKDFTLILENSYDPSRGYARSDVTLFLRKGNRFDRYTESVRERHYKDDELYALLKLAGFHVLEREDFNFTGNPRIGDIKTWWVAQK